MQRVDPGAKADDPGGELRIARTHFGNRPGIPPLALDGVDQHIERGRRQRVVQRHRRGDAKLRETAAALKSAPDEVPARVTALIEERKRLEKELADAKKALAMGGGGKAKAAGPEQVGGRAFLGQVVDGLDPKSLRSEIDALKQRLGSGVAVLVAVNEGRGSVAVGVTDDLAGLVNAVDLVKAAVAALGGQGGGGRPDMAQGGGPDGSKAHEALVAVKEAMEKVAA